MVTGKTSGFGAAEEDIVLLRVDDDGKLLWARRYGGKGDEKGKAVFVTDDGFAITGSSPSWSGGSAFLLRTDAEGYVASLKTYGADGAQYGFGAGRAADGGFLIAGSNHAAGAGGGDAYLVRTDPAGDAGCKTVAVSLGAVADAKISPKAKFFLPKVSKLDPKVTSGGKFEVPEMGQKFSTVVCPCE